MNGLTQGKDPAFPFSPADGSTMDALANGLTTRELFAAIALQGLLANPERYKYIAGRVAMPAGQPYSLTQEEATAKNARKAVYLADALIEALNASSTVKCP